jgi:3-dehydroquinate synthetase
VKRAGLPEEERKAIFDLVQKFELPTRLPKDFPPEKIIDAIGRDKKFENGQVRFVVTPRIGTAILSPDVTLDDIRQAIGEL